MKVLREVLVAGIGCRQRTWTEPERQCAERQGEKPTFWLVVMPKQQSALSNLEVANSGVMSLGEFTEGQPPLKISPWVAELGHSRLAELKYTALIGPDMFGAAPHQQLPHRQNFKRQKNECRDGLALDYRFYLDCEA